MAEKRRVFHSTAPRFASAHTIRPPWYRSWDCVLQWRFQCMYIHTAALRKVEYVLTAHHHLSPFPPFQSAYFLKTPNTSELYMHLVTPPEKSFHGRMLDVGDVKVRARLKWMTRLSLKEVNESLTHPVFVPFFHSCMMGRAIFVWPSIAGTSSEPHRLTERIWQPYALPSCAMPTSSSPSAIADSVLSGVVDLQKATSGSCVFRLLEVVESDGTACIIETLSRLQVPQGVLVEAWVGSHDSDVLAKTASGVSQQAMASWLRLRKVSSRSSHQTFLSMLPCI